MSVFDFDCFMICRSNCCSRSRFPEIKRVGFLQSLALLRQIGRVALMLGPRVFEFTEQYMVLSPRMSQLAPHQISACRSHDS